MVETKDALLASGAAFVAGMLYFYRKRQTVPFKVCYALAWPTLGGGTMLSVMPETSEVERRVLAGGESPAELARRREANAAAIARLRSGSLGGGGPSQRQQDDRGGGGGRG